MKSKFTVFKLVVAIVWVASLALIGAGMALISGPQKQAVERAQREVLESQEQLAFAQNAQKGDARHRLTEELEQTRQLVGAFTCSPATESGLIFEIGRLAHTLGLEKFTSRLPENMPEQTLQDSEHIKEAWLTVEFSADYAKTAAFVNHLERHRPVLFVETIHLRRGDGEAQEPSARITVSYFVNRKPGEKETEVAGAI